MYLNKSKFFLLAITCTILASCTCCSRQKSSTPVDIQASIIYDRDSLDFYMERAYLHDDPQGLFVTAAAAYLKWQGDERMDSLFTIPRDEADIMLLHSAQMGYQPAIDLIRCLHDEGFWNHSLPETK